MRVVTNEVCYEDEHLAKIISYRTMCAGGELAGPCRGDSGGGLYTPRGKKMFVRGIVSASLFTQSGHCDISRKAVFTKVEKFTSWINSILGVNLELNCEFLKSDEHYSCKPRNLKVEHDNIKVVDTSGEHVGELGNINVNELVIHGQQTPYLPVGMDKIFPNLLTYFAGASGLKFIEKSNFDGLTYLKKIEFGVNLIERIPKDTFNDLPNLELLLLHANKIESLDRDLFIKNVNLKQFYVYGNRIEFLDEGIFRKNLKLEGIHMDNNLLMFIEPDLLTPLLNLKVANFNGNVCLSKHFPNSATKSQLREIFVAQCKI